MTKGQRTNPLSSSTITVTIDEEYAPIETGAKRDLGYLEARQVTVTASSIPTYAAVCSSAERYASACSCFGVTGSVTTAPQPTVTVTTTVDYCDDL